MWRKLCLVAGNTLEKSCARTIGVDRTAESFLVVSAAMPPAFEPRGCGNVVCVLWVVRGCVYDFVPEIYLYVVNLSLNARHTRCNNRQFDLYGTTDLPIDSEVRPCRTKYNSPSIHLSPLLYQVFYSGQAGVQDLGIFSY